MTKSAFLITIAHLPGINRYLWLLYRFYCTAAWTVFIFCLFCFVHFTCRVYVNTTCCLNKRTRNARLFSFICWLVCTPKVWERTSQNLFHGACSLMPIWANYFLVWLEQIGSVRRLPFCLNKLEVHGICNITIQKKLFHCREMVASSGIVSMKPCTSCADGLCHCSNGSPLLSFCKIYTFFTSFTTYDAYLIYLLWVKQASYAP